MPSKLSARFKRTVVVSYRLPYKTVEENGRKTIVQNSGGLVSAMSALSEGMAQNGGSELYRNVVWVGKSDGIFLEDSAGKKGFVKGLLKKYVFGIDEIPRVKDRVVSPINDPNGIYQVVPVEIDNAINDKYYGGFCNDCIWPLFHYFPSLVIYDEIYFENYILANKLFAEKVKTIIQPDDFVWIHDYQLLLLPALLRKDFPLANIGFFLHIPFPAFEVFRVLPRRWRDALLSGMLGADVIGFHTFDYSQYFLRTVSRLLGNEITMNTVNVDDRVVKVDAFPIGIDYEKFNDAAMNSKSVEVEKQKILTTLQKKKLIFSVDRLDYTKGLLKRLEAFEFFLETYPEWMEKIVFNMVVIPSRDTIVQYQNMKREIEAAVGRINGKYNTMAWQPIFYQYKSLSFDELVALYDISLVGLITPMRDGMNVVAKEYVASQVTEKGVLILSEMAGAAAELSEAILINPADKQEVAEAINKALTMPLRSRTILLSHMQRRIKNYTVFSWAKDIIENLELIKKEQEMRRVNLITPAIESEIIAQFAKASKRVIFLDYDGTLVPFSRVPELATPDAQTLKQLKSLADYPNNAVVLISGRDKNFLEEWFGKLNIYLIAEHGAFQKSPGEEWKCAIDADQGWKSALLPVLQRYMDQCNGSFVEEKFSSLAWHYRNSSPEIGIMKAKELKEELRTIVAHENKLHVIEGNMVIEVKRTGYDKGVAALKFISDKKFDFIIAMGDDKTDEDIYRSLPSKAVSIKIGIAASMAKYNLSNQQEVSRFIDKFIEIEQKSR
jgi:trehalose 6-phosphate synthase/phosphatase